MKLKKTLDFWKKPGYIVGVKRKMSLRVERRIRDESTEHHRY